MDEGEGAMSLLDMIVTGVKHVTVHSVSSQTAVAELRELRDYADRMKAERDAWSEEAGRLGMALAQSTTKCRTLEGLVDMWTECVQETAPRDLSAFGRMKAKADEWKNVAGRYALALERARAEADNLRAELRTERETRYGALAWGSHRLLIKGDDSEAVATRIRAALNGPPDKEPTK